MKGEDRRFKKKDKCVKEIMRNKQNYKTSWIRKIMSPQTSRNNYSKFRDLMIEISGTDKNTYLVDFIIIIF